MKEKALHYHAYLLRFWREDEQSAWRASLEDPHTGQTQRFASVQRLYEFLNERMDGSADEGSTPSDDSQGP